MRIISVPLPLDTGALAQGYLHDPSPELPRKARPCVVICPGGGYEMVSDREKDPVALAFLAAGYQVFTLTYSVGDAASGLRPLMELSSLVMSIRDHAAEWHVRPDQIAVMGFSAGGHLAASLGTLWNTKRLQAQLDTRGGQNRPNALVLCYPVITAGPHAHRGSILRVTGGDASQEDFFSLEKQVSPETPPSFLWHTQDDPGVPVENTLLFCQALREQGVDFASHIFAHGAHGLSLCNEEVGTPHPGCAPWFALCLGWLGELFDFKA